MFGIGKDTAVRDAIGVTIAIVTAILLFGAAQMVPAMVTPMDAAEPVIAQEIGVEPTAAAHSEVEDAAPAAPAPLGRI